MNASAANAESKPAHAILDLFGHPSSTPWEALSIPKRVNGPIPPWRERLK